MSVLTAIQHFIVLDGGGTGRLEANPNRKWIMFGSSVASGTAFKFGDVPTLLNDGVTQPAAGRPIRFDISELGDLITRSVGILGGALDSIAIWEGVGS